MRVVKLVVSLSLAGFDALASAARRIRGLPVDASAVVLYYHAIPAGARRQFAAQMDQLKQLTETVDAEADWRLVPGRRYSAVTFDDAFMSVLDHALPELRARSIPCTIFVPTGSLGHPPRWIGAKHADAAEVVASPESLRAIAADPLVGIGSHSVSHPNFRLLDDVSAREELERSKRELESLLVQPILSFSFPHGAYTHHSLELAKQCGYTRVFTIEPTRLIGDTGAFTVGRVRVEPGDWPIEFRLKTIGAYRWMVHASALKRRLVGLLRAPRVHTNRVEQG